MTPAQQDEIRKILEDLGVTPASSEEDLLEQVELVSSIAFNHSFKEYKAIQSGKLKVLSVQQVGLSLTEAQELIAAQTNAPCGSPSQKD